MTGPEHYLQAEHDLANANHAPEELSGFYLKSAHVHAMLAVAASNIAASYNTGGSRNTSAEALDDWIKVGAA